MIPTFYKPQFINLGIAFSLIFFSASIRSLNIFTVPIEAKQPLLTSVWSRGLALEFLLYAIGSFFTVPFLSLRSSPILIPSSSHSLTNYLRSVSCAVCAIYLTLSLAVPAIRYASPLLMYMATGPQGLPFAYFYLVGVDALMSWLPHNPGTAMSVSTLGFGVSQTVLSTVLHMSIVKLGVENTLIVTAVALWIMSSICSYLLEFPSGEDHYQMTQIHDATSPDSHRKNAPQYNDIETHSKPDIKQQAEIVSHEETQLTKVEGNCSWRALFRSAKFYRYIMLIFLGRTPIAFYPYFFKLGDVYGLTMDKMVQAFQILSVSNPIWVFVTGWSYERLSRNFHRSVTQPFLFSMFVLQGILFFVLSVYSSGTVALLCMALEIMLVESQTAFTVIKAGDLFGEKNRMLVYGLAGGLTVGPSGAFFTLVMSTIEKRFCKDGVSIPETFLPYYALGKVCCVAGALLTCFV